jgi:hypothetical protein
MVTAGDLRTTTGHAQVDEIIASIVTGYEAALPGLALGFEQYFLTLSQPGIFALPAV